MSDRSITESTVEQVALAWLESLDWSVAHGPDIAPDTPGAERSDYGQVVLERRLRAALAELNPNLPVEALDDAFRRLTRPEGAALEARNRAFHRMVLDGVTVEHRTNDGRVRGAQARVIDFEDPANNDWLAVNQFTVSENTRRPDIVLFVNGLPLGIIELKNPAGDQRRVEFSPTTIRIARFFRADLDHGKHGYKPADQETDEIAEKGKDVDDGRCKGGHGAEYGTEVSKVWEATERVSAGEDLENPTGPLRIGVAGSRRDSETISDGGGNDRLRSSESGS